MAMFDKETEKEMVKFVKKKVKLHLNDRQICDLIYKNFGHVITDITLGLLRKRNNIKSGYMLKLAEEKKIAIDVWGKTNSVADVCRALSINRSSAISKLKHLHNVGEINADRLFDVRQKNRKEEPKKFVTYEETLISSQNMQAMIQRKIDLVARLQDMTTL